MKGSKRQTDTPQTGKLLNDVAVSMSDISDMRGELLLNDLLADPGMAHELLEAAGPRSYAEYREKLACALWPYVSTYKPDLMDQLLKKTVVGSSLNVAASNLVFLALRDKKHEALTSICTHVAEHLTSLHGDQLQPYLNQSTRKILNTAITLALKPRNSAALSCFLQFACKTPMPFQEHVREHGFEFLLDNSDKGTAQETEPEFQEVAKILLSHGAQVNEIVLHSADRSKIPVPTPILVMALRAQERKEQAGFLVDILLDAGVDWRSILNDWQLSPEDRQRMEQSPWIRRILLDEHVSPTIREMETEHPLI